METFLTPEDDFPGRLLHQAALWDNHELLEDLLRGDEKEHINSQDSWGRTPLHAAALTDKSKCLGVLLTSGADPDIPCGPKGELRTALHISAECGHMSNVKLLLQYGAKLTAKDKLGLTPLDLAERSEQKECVPFLQEAANEKENHKMQIYSLLREACLSKNLEKVKSLLDEAGAEIEMIINYAPNGSNTLLFLCTEANEKELMTVLLDHGADGRFHPVTKYSPLYIACYNGYIDCVDILLKRFPALVRHWTVEKWLPIHAACIGGHVNVLELLLNFPYPQDFLVKYCDISNEWEYLMPFDINMKDASGQTVLYLASLLGNLKLVDTLLKFKVKATRIRKNQKSSNESEIDGNSEASNKKRISDGIQNIMHRLNLRSKFEGHRKQEIEKSIRPVLLDSYCSEALETALHVAVRNKHREIALLLLNSGADPNLSTLRATRNKDDDSETGSCLEEACKNRDITLIDCLLKYGARDDSTRALSLAVENKDDILMAKLLAIRAHADPEYKLNKKVMAEQLPTRGFVASATLTYSSVFPNTPVMINWHGPKCHMTEIKMNWLVEAALHVNPKLKLNPKNLNVALFAITRLDLSNNALTFLPISVFQLPSLRYLNLSQNKLEKLPSDEDPVKREQGKKTGYNLPVIEELCCQNNRLESIPDQIFNLPSLTVLDLSNNKLQKLPANMWVAPQLKELNVSLNLLQNLPASTQTVEVSEEVKSLEDVIHCDVFEKKNVTNNGNTAYFKSLE
ncbi:hypothetical protein RUM44_012007 [Polyplax serrata]|uniref:Uncharacterized protein n=1 Tax=Polyplax serrata TaxID=468196 RepID=A0ABR1BA37_POLSC